MENLQMVMEKYFVKSVGTLLRQFVRRFRLNRHIPVSHTNRRPIENTISVVMNRLVGMGLKTARVVRP